MAYVKPTFVVTNNIDSVSPVINQVILDYNAHMMYLDTSTSKSDRKTISRITDLATDVAKYYLPLKGGTLTGALQINSNMTFTGTTTGPVFSAQYASLNGEPSYRFMRLQKDYSSKTMWSKMYFVNSNTAQIAFAFCDNYTSGGSSNSVTYSTKITASGVLPYSSGSYALGNSSSIWGSSYINKYYTPNGNSYGFYAMNTSGSAVRLIWMNSNNYTCLGNSNYNSYIYGSSLTTGCSILPSTDSAYNLGSSSKYWNMLYSDSANIGALTIRASAVKCAGNFYPSADSTYSLGTSSLYWKTLYVDKAYIPEAVIDNLTLRHQLVVQANSQYAGQSKQPGAITTYGDIDPYKSGVCDLGGSSYYWRCVYSDKIRYYTSCKSASDKRLKKNITTLDTDKCVNLIMKLNPVSFKFKDKPEDNTHWGFLAQEVRDAEYGINNELVIANASVDDGDDIKYDPSTYTEGNETWYVEYNALIAPMIKMNQEMYKTIQNLSEEVEILKATVERLLNKM